MQILIFPKLFCWISSPLFIPLVNSSLYFEINPQAISQNSITAFISEKRSFLPLPQLPLLSLLCLPLLIQD